MQIHEDHPELALRLAALADPVNDSDWLEVRRRARVFSAPRPLGVRRTALRPLRTVAVAASVGVVLVAAGPALGVDNPIGSLAGRVGSLFGGEPEENFSTHEGRKLPLYLQVGRTEGGGASNVLRGKVFSAEIVSLELRLANGTFVELPLDRQREFRYTAGASRPTDLIARDAAGNVVTRLPVVHPDDSHSG